MIRLAFLLALTVPIAASERTLFNDGWRLARFGPMPDGSTLAEPGGE